MKAMLLSKLPPLHCLCSKHGSHFKVRADSVLGSLEIRHTSSQDLPREIMRAVVKLCQLEQESTVEGIAGILDLDPLPVMTRRTGATDNARYCCVGLA